MYQVTLITESSKNLGELLKKGFKRSVFWSEYKSKIQRAVSGNANTNTITQIILLDTSYQGIDRLFVAVYDVNNVDGVDIND